MQLKTILREPGVRSCIVHSPKFIPFQEEKGSNLV